MDEAANFVPRMAEMERRFKHLRATQPVGFGWMSQDLHPSGAMGEAAEATREKGEASLEHGALAFVELLREVDQFTLAP
jgi:creatinine amidohydrolase